MAGLNHGCISLHVRLLTAVQVWMSVAVPITDDHETLYRVLLQYSDWCFDGLEHFFHILPHAWLLCSVTYPCTSMMVCSWARGHCWIPCLGNQYASYYFYYSLLTIRIELNLNRPTFLNVGPFCFELFIISSFYFAFISSLNCSPFQLWLRAEASLTDSMFFAKS